MIAKVIPVGRFPRHLQEFDYLVPVPLEKTIQVGQLVSIPFRTSQTFGVVFSVEKDTETKSDLPVKSLVSQVSETPFFDEKFLKTLFTLSSWYGVSVAYLLKLCLPPLQKRKLKKIVLNPLQRKSAKQKTETEYFLYSEDKSHSDYFKKTIQKSTGQILLLVPEVAFMEEVYTLLGESDKEQVVFWHGDLGDKEQFERWFQIRNGEKKIIIGTRSAIFLPFYNLDTIIVDYEHHKEYKHAEQNPRFNIKDIVNLFQKQDNISVYFTSFSISCEKYFSVHKKLLKQQKETKPLTKPAPTCIDMRSERSRKNYGPFSYNVENKLQNLSGDAFIFMQRRGTYSSLGCLDCGYVDVCSLCSNPLIFHEDDNKLHCHYCKNTIPLPLRCPKCKSTLLRMLGAGTQLLESTVRKILGGKKEHTVIRIDSDVNDIEYKNKNDGPRIIIGTEKALPFIRWEKTELVVCADIDRQLLVPEYLALENMWHFLAHIQFYRPAESTFFIQTRNPEHHLFAALDKKEKFYREELNARHQFVYPPHCFLLRYLASGEGQGVTEKEANRIFKKLEEALTKNPKPIKILGPLELHPHYYRRKYWYAIIVKMSVKDWEENLPWLNQFIPGNWRIDPSPVSLLQP